MAKQPGPDDGLDPLFQRLHGRALELTGIKHADLSLVREGRAHQRTAADKLASAQHGNPPDRTPPPPTPPRR